MTNKKSRAYGRKNNANSQSKNRPAASTTEAAVTDTDDDGAPSQAAGPAAGLSTATTTLLLTSNPSPGFQPGPQGASPAQGIPPLQQQSTLSANDMATMITALHRNNEEKAAVIEGHIIEIKEHQNTIDNQIKTISTQEARFLQIEAHIKHLQLALSTNKEVGDTKNKTLKREVSQQHVKISQLIKESERAAVQTNILEQKVSRQKTKISNMGKNHYTTKTELESHIKGYKDTILLLEVRIETQHEEIQNLKLYSFGENPSLSLVRIKCRAVIDRGLGIIYEAVTGLKPDKSHHQVKRWIAVSLNPSSYRSLAILTDSERAHLDSTRYQACCRLLAQRSKISLPEYVQLIRSGTLRFLTQSSINLRNHANENAHELVEPQIANLRQCLDRAKKDNVIDTICSSEDLSGIEGTMAFIESSHPKPPSVASSSTTKTTVELKITTETSTMIHHKTSEY
ncbi:hypothetical protein HYPSUDRAFT_203584 [Hypholoma sublateritium FD-334 SS-4]|uniref:Uncharacterized protein n=1 Tax=Hypholoma sublateritium (strain FD-334 SS-4) TaxID=945553 RepID=A0A0D2PKZ4_HYPSF|nr:hypothetical protein HYPSUDRAFT_203584 [Hypholoma sublateritium FD-334 SS-4]